MICINDLPDGLSSNVRIFADGTSLFSVVHNIHSSASNLNKDLKTINEWAFQWKISFNPDPNKQAQEVIFSRKSKNMRHPPLIFNKSKVFQSTTQKHLGLILNNRLSFKEYLTAMGTKVSRIIALVRKFQLILPRNALITIYKSFVRPYQDYGDILYDKAFNASFHLKIESIQHNGCLAITGAIRGSWVWNNSNIDHSIENYATFIKYITKSHLTIFSNQYPIKNHHTLPETLIIFHSSNFLIIFSKIRFFRPLLLNGTN